ncbi:uncharacterized protein LOC117330184 [Pecten maximus]|uniref:uncharacterized protein LOC117330184 n=1 Tax=Pecten maximus TaxID=6579 RepID=UPI001457E9C2|nr:uncharacterized protein LOC117330184 [Pecten maximus]
MATKCASSNLKDYIGSKEEATIQTLATEIAISPRFCNLVIQCSNAHEGTPFTDASITLKIVLETWYAMRTNYADGIPKFAFVRMEDILNASVLDDFVADGVKGIEKCNKCIKQSFLALLEFLRNKDHHEKAIQKLIKTNPSNNGCKKTCVMVALGQHLFSQLIPGKVYAVDKLAKHVPNKCSCGCKAEISGGNTSVGASGTWHGRVDILLNETIAVAVLSRERDEEDENDENDHDSDEDEPPIKQMKEDECDVCMEEKTDAILLEHKVMNKILALAITNGFAQVNMHKGTLLDYMIPTFGATSEHVTICLYDPENDILFHIKEELELWFGGTPEKLHVRTIFIIWLFLNFTAFTRRKLLDFIDLDKTGFHDQLKGYLNDYQNAKTQGQTIEPGSSAKVWKDIPGKDKKRKNQV